MLGTGESPEEATDEFVSNASFFVQYERDNGREGLFKASEGQGSSVRARHVLKASETARKGFDEKVCRSSEDSDGKAGLKCDMVSGGGVRCGVRCDVGLFLPPKHATMGDRWDGRPMRRMAWKCVTAIIRSVKSSELGRTRLCQKQDDRERRLKDRLSELNLQNEKLHSSREVQLKLVPLDNVEWVPIEEALAWDELPL